MVGAGLLARNAVAAGPVGRPDGQDQPRPGIAGGHRVPGACRAHGPAGRPRLRPRRATAARPASATAGRSTRRSPRPSRTTTWWWRPCSRATATSRAASIPRCGRATSPPRPWSWRIALAGRVDIDLTTEPLGTDRAGVPVFLSDIWPRAEEIRTAIGAAVTPALFRSAYASVFEGDERWRALPVPGGDRYAWDPGSSYIALPPFFEGLTAEPAPITDIVGARVLAVLGDSVTTDHISPAGSIPRWSPAGEWLQAQGVAPLDFNSYGARRGHHEVMMRGTFGNIRLRNALADKEGPYTTHQPDGDADVPVRRRDAVPGRGHAAGDPRGHGVRQRQLPRLGGQGHAAAGRAGGHRPELRAHPPLEPGGHGRAAAAVPARPERRIAGPGRPRVVRHHRAWARA